MTTTDLHARAPSEAPAVEPEPVRDDVDILDGLIVREAERLQQRRAAWLAAGAAFREAERGLEILTELRRVKAGAGRGAVVDSAPGPVAREDAASAPGLGGLARRDALGESPAPNAWAHGSATAPPPDSARDRRDARGARGARSAAAVSTGAIDRAGAEPDGGPGHVARGDAGAADELQLPLVDAASDLRYRVAVVLAEAGLPLTVRVLIERLAARGWSPESAPKNRDRSVRRAMAESKDLRFEKRAGDTWALVSPVRLAPSAPHAAVDAPQGAADDPAVMYP